MPSRSPPSCESTSPVIRMNSAASSVSVSFAKCMESSSRILLNDACDWGGGKSPLPATVAIELSLEMVGTLERKETEAVLSEDCRAVSDVVVVVVVRFAPAVVLFALLLGLAAVVEFAVWKKTLRVSSRVRKFAAS